MHTERKLLVTPIETPKLPKLALGNYGTSTNTAMSKFRDMGAPAT